MSKNIIHNQGVYVYRIIENNAIIDTGKIIINK